VGVPAQLRADPPSTGTAAGRAGRRLAADRGPYLYYARHAGAYERLLLSPGRLILEFHSGSATTREELDPWLARIEVACARIPGFDGEGLVIVSGSGRSVRLARFVPVTQRPALAAWLRQEVRQALNRGALVARGDPAQDLSAEPQTAS